MNRVTDILNFTLPDGIIDSFGLESAYCACLTPAQACDLLRQCAVGRVDLRGAALRKVCNDIDTSHEDVHTHLVMDLIAEFSEVDSKGRQSLGYCLTMLAGHLPPHERRSIQEFFLSSRYIGIRRRAYKSIATDQNPLQDAVREAWRRFSDPGCAWLIVKTFPVEFLVQNRRALVSCLSEGWQLSRLYLRIAQAEPATLDELKTLDEISYCYVLAKLGKALPLQEAIDIVSRRSQDERFGLLVWSLGQQKLWSALQHVESQLSAIQEGKLSALMARHGI